MDSSVSPKDEMWFLRVCHHISNVVYLQTPGCGLDLSGSVPNRRGRLLIMMSLGSVKGKGFFFFFLANWATFRFSVLPLLRKVLLNLYLTFFFLFPASYRLTCYFSLSSELHVQPILTVTSRPLQYSCISTETSCRTLMYVPCILYHLLFIYFI